MPSVITRGPCVLVETDKFVFLANHPGLDFINTRVVKRNGRVELLETPRDLLLWMFAGYLISSRDFAMAEQNWLKRPAMAEALLDALKLRDVLDRTVKEMTERKSPDPGPETLGLLNRYLATPGVLSRLTGERPARRLEEYAASPEGLVPLIARQVSRIFTDLEPNLIKKCRDEKCILFFYDTSKNHARAWCSMESCGNRAKASKHYHDRE